MTDTPDIKSVLPVSLCECTSIPFIKTAFKKSMSHATIENVITRKPTTKFQNALNFY